VRKLRINERIFGTMTLALEYGIEPKNIALGAMAGIAVLLKQRTENSGQRTVNAERCSLNAKLPNELRFGDWRKLDDAGIEKIINWLWTGQSCSYAGQIIRYVQKAKKRLEILIADSV